MARTFTPMAQPASPIVRSITDFGTFIRARRTAEKLRIDTTAALCNVSVQLLSDLERGQRSVGLENALHVAGQLGLEVLVLPREKVNRLLRQLALEESQQNSPVD